jgi:hypothetical protein
LDDSRWKIQTVQEEEEEEAAEEGELTLSDLKGNLQLFCQFV